MRRFTGGDGGGPPLCVTVTVWPATVMVPVRAIVVGETVKFTDPSPDMPPLVIVIHATELVAVQAQPEPVTTERLPFSPVDGADTLVGATL
jgi:hypothetical protein